MAPAARFLPMSPEEMAALGWRELDVLIVTGDAYVDHPAFGAAVVGRWLEARGLRVGVVAQPDWRSTESIARLGAPRLFVGVTAGNLDSMLAKRTAQNKPRRRDEYAPGGEPGRRPDRASIVYANLCRRAFGAVPIVVGGIEASLRRLAHYDTWADAVRRSILLDAKADLLVYGMAERALGEIAERLRAGRSPADLPGIAGTAHVANRGQWEHLATEGAVMLPSYDEVRDDPRAFARMTRLSLREASPHNGRTLVQAHGEQAVVVAPPAMPFAPAELDRIYELPYARAPHPSYRAPVPAFESVRHSVVATRGCPGGCAFCALTEHQGRAVQSRSASSVLREVRALAQTAAFRGTVTDVGGPTANCYGLGCARPELEARCRRSSCLYPRICRHFRTDHEALLALLAALRREPGVEHVYLASGIRHDLALCAPRFVRALAQHHTPGQLSVAPEHVSAAVLRCMRKPDVESYEQFAAAFAAATGRAGKEQHLVPYYLAAHPGTTLEHMVELACYLKRRGVRPRQVQQFIATPMTRATAMQYTGLDPVTGEQVVVARSARERRWHKALLLYWDPTHHDDVRAALRQIGRTDLIGSAPSSLVPPAGGRGALPRRMVPGKGQSPGGRTRQRKRR